jgi:hypothetical protein
MLVSLGKAAKLAGVGKSTLTRAIKAGRLSASRRDDGSYEVDVAELSRVYSIRPETPETVAQSSPVVHHATPPETPRDPEVTARLAALEQEVKGLRELLDEVKASREELRQERDQWREQAAEVKRITGPKDESATEPMLRAWLRRLVG